jgi:uncharacterized protein (DUF305 family)
MKTDSLLSKNAFVRALAAAALATTGVLIGASPALAQAGSGTQRERMHASGADGSTKMHAAMQDNQKRMNDMQMSGDTDRDFAMMMRTHHQAGIDMAKAEVESGKDHEMIKEAKKIIASQQKDIRKFDAWLKKHPAK